MFKYVRPRVVQKLVTQWRRCYILYPCEPQLSDITHFILRLLKDISRNIF